MIPDNELEQKLRRLGDAVAPGASIVNDVMHSVEHTSISPSRPGHTRRYPIMRSKTSKWITIAASAAVILIVVNLWTGTSQDGIVWADVVQQIRTARTARIHLTSHDPKATRGSNVTSDIYLKAPDKMRADILQPLSDGRSIIINGHEQVMLIESKKLYQVESKPNNYAEQLLTQHFAFPGGQETEDDSGRLSLGGAETGKLAFRGVEERNGRKLLKYHLDVSGKPQEQPLSSEATRHTFYWFDPSSKMLALITSGQVVDETLTETASATFEMNIDLPNDLFSTEIPPGYTVVPKVAMSPGMGDKTRQLLIKYEQARESIQRYRLIVWSSSQRHNYPRMRSLRDGERWRVDEVRCDKDLTPNSNFETVWKQLVVSSHGNTALTHGGRVATIRRLSVGISAVWSDDPNSRRYQLADLGWPRPPGGFPMATVGNPFVVFQRLPDRSDRLGLIGIRIESNYPDDRASSQTLQVLWIDPARDYLCVHNEYHVRKDRPWRDKLDWIPTEPKGDPAEDHWKDRSGEDSMTQILEFGQTPDGRWYPKTLKRSWATIADGKRYPLLPHTTEHIQLDVTGAISEELFEWPTDVPKPKP